MIHFTLYSRAYCHLCDDMFAALQALGGEPAFTVEVLDVDADAALCAQYDELVPVLVGKRDAEDPLQLCHYFLDASKVNAFIRGAQVDAELHRPE